MKFAYVIISIFILSSCGNPSSETGFENTQSAIQFYKSFLSEIQQIDTVSIEDLCREVCKWRTNRDSVIKFIKSEKTPHTNSLDPIREIDNDIAKEIARLIPPLCSFADVLYFKHNTIAFPRADSLDNIISSAHAYFDELDSATVKYRSCNIVIEEYIQFLNRFSIDGIHSLEQLKDFIKQEDYHFTSYLQHLTNIDNDAISTITTGTESCYMEIYNAAERGDFGMNEMLTYVTIRTNRRLLANAWSCLRHIQDSNVDNESQAFSCYWMLIQPFISIDDFGMQLLSLRDKAMLSRPYRKDILMPRTGRARESQYTENMQRSWLKTVSLTTHSTLLRSSEPNAPRWRLRARPSYTTRPHAMNCATLSRLRKASGRSCWKHAQTGQSDSRCRKTEL